MSRPGRRAQGHSLGGIFAVPGLLAIASIVGLLSALIGDEIWDALSWVTLGIPIAVIGWMLRPHARGGSRSADAKS